MCGSVTGVVCAMVNGERGGPLVVTSCGGVVRLLGWGGSDRTSMAFCMVVLCDSIVQVVLWWRRGETLGVG